LIGLCFLLPLASSEETEDTAKEKKWGGIGGVIVRGDLDRLRAILEKSPKLKTDPHVMAIAARHGNKEILAHFMSEGADFNAPFREGLAGLHLAARSGNREGIQVLLEHKADIEAADLGGFRPLHWAAGSGQTEATELLLQNNADVNSKATNVRTPLICAAEKGHKDVVLLLLKYKADLGLKDRRGRTALHWAAAGGHLEVVKTLLAFGADPNDKADKDKIPLDLTESNEVKLVLQGHRRGMKYGYEARRQSDDERAASLLSVAKSYAGNKIYKLAERNAKAIIKDYPKTEAAAQARELLEEIRRAQEADK
jgi:ankyrin repeat protein